ncbi:MAG: MBL fold metallo-hydrolase [Chloroflexi bacterium]|nr:MBL fold metallo-hydrolase [Chloroflexota bacterium]
MLRELAEGVFVEDGFEGGNNGLILTRRGALLVDTPMLPPEARQWQLKLMQMGIGDIYGIVNTDYHPEHFWGNAFFMPTRTFGNEQADRPIAKYRDSAMEKLAEEYRAHDPVLAQELAQLKIIPPEISVNDQVTLYMGDRQVQILHLSGHTPASLGVYLPELKILFAGDNVVNNEHPEMYDADTLGWLRTLKKLQAMDIDVIVPGRGEPCGKEALQPLYNYIVEMRRRVVQLFKEGASRRETVEKVGMLDFFPVPEEQLAEVKMRKRHSIERVYTEVRISIRNR